MGTGFSKRKKQAKQLQEQLSKMQEQIQTIEVTGTAGNGLVTVTLNGDHELKKITIKPECVDPEDIEGLEDLIQAAYKEAYESLKKKSQASQMALPSLPGGLPHFGGF